MLNRLITAFQVLLLTLLVLFLLTGKTHATTVGNDISTGGSLTVFGTTNIGSGTFFVDPNNHWVGIGTTNPTQALEVNGTIKANDIIAKGPVVDVRAYGAVGNGVTDDTVAIQAALDGAAGRAIFLQDGSTYLISPIGDKSKFLNLPVGTIIQGRGILKVKSGSAPYDAVLYSNNCTNCSISDITIDSNVAGNPLVNNAEIMAHGRIEAYISSGTDITFNGVTIKNSSSVNSISLNGVGIKRVTVRNNNFYNIGDDSNHVVHDHSTLYLHGSQIIVMGNHFTGASRNAPGAVTAIEMHGTGQIISNNTIVDYSAGINFTGISGEYDTEASSISSNSMLGVLNGVVIWSMPYGSHTSGFGINGLTVGNNSIRINQISYDTGLTANGIVFSPTNNLLAHNINIINNTIVFDQEMSPRTGNSASIGIGAYNVAGSYSSIRVSNNTIDNAPVAGIRFAVATIEDLVIENNIIRNAGSSLDSEIVSDYKVPIFTASVGVLGGEISSNKIIDDFTTSRITRAFLLGAGESSNVKMLWNSVDIADETAASWLIYLQLQDNNVNPLFRQIVSGKPWVPPFSMRMRSGSQVYDATVNKQYYLWADGTDWTDNMLTGNIGIGTTNPSEQLDISGNTIRVRTEKTPTSATAVCDKGEIIWDADYVYVCVATDTWKRSALTTW